MNWEAINAVGEIVGATAVVVTLIYVAVSEFECCLTANADAQVPGCENLFVGHWV